MKKFLKKKPVMLTFAITAVVLLVVYIGMLVRPVAVGFTYKGQSSNNLGSYTEIYDYECKINSGKKLTSKIKTTRILGDTKTISETEKEMYYFVKDGLIVMDNLGTVHNDDEYKEWKKDIKNNWNNYKEDATKTNAFVIGEGDGSSLCVGSIVFAIVGGIVLVVVSSFATMSVMANTKKKKKRK